MVNLVITSAIDGSTNRVEGVGREIQKSVARLSSGSAIANPGDNVASLAISSRLATSVIAQNAINTNISNGVSAAQTADGAYAQTLEMLTRLNGIALNATSENLSDAERALLDGEYQALLEEIDRIAKDTEFNGIKLAETGVTPIVAASNFADSTLPGGSFIPTGGNNTAVIADGVLRLIDEPDPALVQGVYVNDKDFVLTAGLTADFTVEVGLPAGTSPTALGGGFSFFLFDGGVVDFSGAVAPPLGSPGASNLLYYNGTTTPAAGGFLAVGFESFGGFGNAPNVDDAVTVVGPGVNQQLGTVNLTAANGFPNGLDGVGSTSAASAQNRFDINLSISEDLVLNVRLTDLGSGNSAQVVDNLDISGLDVPDSLKFGFGATINTANNRFAVDAFDVQANTDVETRMNLAARSFKASASTNARTQDLLLPLFDATIAGLALEQTNIRSKASAEFAIERLEFAIDQTVEARAVIGAALGPFEGAQDFLSTKILNLESARSGLADLNVADEIAKLTALQIQNSAGVGVIQDGQQLLRNTILLLQSSEGVASAL